MNTKKKKGMVVRTGIFILVTAFVCIPLSVARGEHQAVHAFPGRIMAEFTELFR